MITDMNKLIMPQSKSLFALDDFSYKILGFIAKSGPSTVYSIEGGSGVSRQSIYRRLEGEKGITGLLSEQFLKLDSTIKFPKIANVWKKLYGLTFKGFLASLAETSLEKVYLYKAFFEAIKQKAGLQVAEAAERYIKAEVALWLDLQIENGLNLTNLKHAEKFYTETRRTLFEAYDFPHDWLACMLELLREQKKERYDKIRKRLEDVEDETFEELYLKRTLSKENFELFSELEKQTHLLREVLFSLEDQELAEILYILVGEWHKHLGMDPMEISKLNNEELAIKIWGTHRDDFEPESAFNFEHPYKIDLRLKEEALGTEAYRPPEVDTLKICSKCGSIFVFEELKPFENGKILNEHTCLKCGNIWTTEMESSKPPT